ncbi:adenosylcobinamide-GDP ribazoletransferase [Shewanella psychrotolerans]|uniref:adenosylcobinamide-GDP ribazoletransferase n=1 Tax=Shewanella psychrotolerans TaxID=2864206 RepID=UPI001C6612A8|nr:adenosylcobinamide-GDP ribazoletransferase [Shewanella psychrotolerans]QYK03211.1 adenosylcobinamide-GDP ribazoletransferase [Shewanella psychrotolerans]
MMIKELQLFFIAMGFFTRIPMPKWVEVNSERLNQASRYFGAVGIVVGGISALVYVIASELFPSSIAIVLAMIASVLTTGGFHEDGLADTADGFGGGWTLQDKLTIMKDSRVGTYGVLALVFALLLKFVLLSEIALYAPHLVVSALIVSHCLSRVLAASLIFSEPYVREDASSKSKPLAQSQTINELAILLITGALALWISRITAALGLCALLLVLRYLLIWGFRRQIGGYTGDTLGAAQQVSELSVYLFILALAS